MPVYVYCCKNEQCECDTFETHESIKADPLEICPYCGIASISRVPQIPMYIKVKEIKTLGQLAEQNAKAMGTYALQEKERENEERRLRASEFAGTLPAGASISKRIPMDTPWRKANEKVDLSLTRMTKSQTVKYVMTGKKPIGLR